MFSNQSSGSGGCSDTCVGGILDLLPANNELERALQLPPQLPNTTRRAWFSWIRLWTYKRRYARARRWIRPRRSWRTTWRRGPIRHNDRQVLQVRGPRVHLQAVSVRPHRTEVKGEHRRDVHRLLEGLVVRWKRDRCHQVKEDEVRECSEMLELSEHSLLLLWLSIKSSQSSIWSIIINSNS